MMIIIIIVTISTTIMVIIIMIIIIMIIIMIEVMEGRLKPVEMEGGKALIGDVRSISSSAS